MSKRTLILLALTIIAGIIAIFVYWQPFRKTPYSPDKFTIKDTSSIGKIVLADKQGNVVTLTRQGNRWLVNNEFSAQPENINLLLETIHKQRIKFPAPKPAIPNIIKEMDVSATRVDIYDRDNNKMLTFYIGPATPDNMATYMLAEGDTLPYAVYLPGHIGVLNPRYHTNADEWRKKVIISLEPQDIKSVRVTYPQFKEPGFLLINTSSYELKPIDYPELPDTPNAEIIQFYLNQFRKLGIMKYVKAPRFKDSLLQTTPYATLTVTTLKNDSIKLLFFLHGVDERTKVPFDTETGKPLKYDRDRVWVYNPKTDELMLGQWFVWGRVLRYYPEFFGSSYRPFRQAPIIVDETGLNW